MEPLAFTLLPLLLHGLQEVALNLYFVTIQISPSYGQYTKVTALVKYRRVTVRVKLEDGVGFMHWRRFVVPFCYGYSVCFFNVFDKLLLDSEAPAS